MFYFPSLPYPIKIAYDPLAYHIMVNGNRAHTPAHNNFYLQRSSWFQPNLTLGGITNPNENVWPWQLYLMLTSWHTYLWDNWNTNSGGILKLHKPIKWICFNFLHLQVQKYVSDYQNYIYIEFLNIKFYPTNISIT